MNFLVAVGISIGVLAGIWAQFCGNVGLVAWIGFVSWACFYAAGGKKEGLGKTVAANLSGVFWGFIIITIMNLLNFPYALGVAVVIGAFMMCVQAHIKYLAFIPGAFAGCASYFGSGTDIKAAALSLICGAVLGYLSEVIALYMVKITSKKVDEGKTAE